MAPLAGRLGMAGLPADPAEMISSSGGVTYWATSAKAMRDLDYRPRDLETGLRYTLVGAAA